MEWKTLLAYSTGSGDDELLVRNEYLVAENRILRDQIQGRVRLSDGERKTLAEIGKRLGKKVLEEVATIGFFDICREDPKMLWCGTWLDMRQSWERTETRRGKPLTHRSPFRWISLRSGC